MTIPRAVALLLLAWLRRRRDDGHRGERAGWAVVLTTGLALPILVVTAVFVAAVLEQGRDASGFARGLQRAGYATDPMYADKLQRIINGNVMRQSLIG